MAYPERDDGDDGDGFEEALCAAGEGEILEWDLLEQNAFADFAAHKHLSLKTEVDQDNARDVFKARFDSTVDLYRRINDVDSYHSQKAGTESGWRTTQ